MTVSRSPVDLQLYSSCAKTSWFEPVNRRVHVQPRMQAPFTGFQQLRLGRRFGPRGAL